MKKKLLLVIRWPVGGIRTFIRYVYRDFDPDQWHLTILAPDIYEMKILREDLASLEIRYIPVDESPNFARFSIKVASELIRERYDLVHSHGFTSGLSAVLSAIVSRTPHLMTSHDVINSKQFAGILGRCNKKVMGQMLGLIDTIHSVSYDAQENLLQYFPNLSRRAGKCIVIPNGIEVERFTESCPRNLRAELGIGNDTFLIGFLGRFMAQKGFIFLVEAIELLLKQKKLKKLPLVIAFGDGGYIREEKQVIEERGLESYFHFMPFAPNVAGIIKGLDVVAMPSLWEACGLLAMETLVCGVPFIGSNCIGLREVLQGTPAIVVSSANASDLAEALAQEINVSSRETFLSFRDNAVTLFDVRKTSKSLQDLYKGMI